MWEQGHSCTHVAARPLMSWSLKGNCGLCVPTAGPCSYNHNGWSVHCAYYMRIAPHGIHAPFCACSRHAIPCITCHRCFVDASLLNLLWAVCQCCVQRLLVNAVLFHLATYDGHCHICHLCSHLFTLLERLLTLSCTLLKLFDLCTLSVEAHLNEQESKA